MSKPSIAAILIAATLIVAAGLPGHASAQHAGTGHAMAPPVAVTQAWARASAGLARSGAAFLTLANASGKTATLVGVSTPAARRAALHNHIMDGTIARMRPVPAIKIPAGGSITLRPGGLHIMMMGLEKPLKAGDSFPLTLTFEGGRSVTVTVAVQPVAAMGPAMKGGMQGHGGH